ncbi:hypothetical protein [Oceaniglobus trochenteri]|uniref:hypothetical protein n=1 Tax=Oceaniglobus trochenteri TaxID=2763260 RepID=UPI001CFF5E3B|nr:hypothetical protein [Oceaniglobus trochenteri]
MTVALHSLTARGISATLDLDHGQLHSLEVHRDGRDINPWSRVPWADGPDDPARFAPDMPPHLRRMSGDFFCAPFVRDDVEGAPPHGWTANSAWSLVEDVEIAGGRRATFELGRRVAGATVHKVWTLLDDHPFLYQCHRFTGGQGGLPVAHHAMLDLRRGGVLAFSPKRRAETSANVPEPDGRGGRSILRYPAQSTDLTAFPSAQGPVDLTRYPWAERHVDLVMLVDAPEGPHGWATAVRPADRDVAMLIKPVSVLPQTMLWMSNGGRPYAPWNGEHLGVLGIEEVCSFGPAGRKASCAENALTREGIATAIDLGAAPVVEVRTAMGALPSAAAGPLTMEVGATSVALSDGTRVPFDASLVG